MSMARESVFDFAGGAPAFLRLARAHHDRCLSDPVLNHPFSHPGNPDHVQRLAWYWGQVFGGPTNYTDASDGQTAMMQIHAGMGADDDLGQRFVDCFVRAADDAQLPEDPDFRRVLREYMEWAVRDVHGYNPPGSLVPKGLAMPRWSWDGLQAAR
jgi:hemoglobin